MSMLILRSESIFHRCREEEVGCEMYYPARQSGSLTKDAQVVRLLFALVSLVIANYTIFKCSGSRNSGNETLIKNSKEKSESIRILSAVSWLLVATVMLHFVFTSLANDTNRANFTAQLLLIASLICAMIAWKEKYPAVCAHFVLMPVYLLFGDGLTPALITFIALSAMISKLVPKKSLSFVIALLIPFGFYHLGHSPVISSIPWHAAFIGIPGGATLRILPALFVLIHLNFSAISSVFVIFTNSDSRQQVTNERETLCSNFDFQTSTSWTLIETLVLMTMRATFSCLAASIHRRHLMVWKIFAPKFIFECILTIFFVISVNILSIISGREVYGSKENERREKIQ
ncbi:hypothetical protein GCK72_001993 [Caenorhabditis remanei]|uniref:Uncharacterized protein n=1 Tax=Caenorhabditis remanei TaxID=31234 RepID=A0A6A5HRD1_CAERE|nr:hypothetical protein GCK72_001993 [Caenorhabditis remanei]KAF1770175.1 hypothetical protein GCK72_001993 [Caenorhabditis remanei]